MYCFVILLLFNGMQMSVRRFSAIPHLRVRFRVRVLRFRVGTRVSFSSSDCLVFELGCFVLWSYWFTSASFVEPTIRNTSVKLTVLSSI